MTTPLNAQAQPVAPMAYWGGGATPYHLVSANSTNGTNVKAGPGNIYSLQVGNTNVAARYLKLYNKATAPTVGTDTPVKTLLIPGGTAGAVVVVSFPVGISFTSGIGLGLTTGAADSDTGAVGAGDLIVNLDYQ